MVLVKYFYDNFIFFIAVVVIEMHEAAVAIALDLLKVILSQNKSDNLFF